MAMKALDSVAIKTLCTDVAVWYKTQRKAISLFALMLLYSISKGRRWHPLH